MVRIGPVFPTLSEEADFGLPCPGLSAPSARKSVLARIVDDATRVLRGQLKARIILASWRVASKHAAPRGACRWGPTWNKQSPAVVRSGHIGDTRVRGHG